MQIKKYIIAIIFISLQYTVLNAQFYNTGTASYKTKWKYIKTEKFKLIYPQETESLAQKYASDLLQLYPHISNTVQHSPSSVDIIMYNRSVLSNAYVVWAPKRMEIVTTPPQRQYAHNWLEQLALHEYRHVVQIDKLNQGFTKGLSYFTGQMGVGAMMGFIPLWFLEGDAVVTETALTRTGRGREPGFIQEVKAAELERERRFTYDEFYLGTYKDYAPNHYQYGYFMTAWSRMQFGPDMWGKVLTNVGRRPYSFAPFYFGLKKQTGLSKVQLYSNTANYLNSKWSKEDPAHQNQNVHSKSVNTSYKSNYASYRFPYLDTNGSVLALRTSIDDIARIVGLKNGVEDHIFSIGTFSGSKVTYSNRYIAWEEIQYDPRWERQNYSLIRIYDRLEEHSFVLRKKSRHFCPEISPNSERICLIYNDSINFSFLNIYNISNKSLLQSFEVSDNAQLSYPTWLDDENIAVVVLTKKGKSIHTININTGEKIEILKPGFENISNLKGHGNKLYFTYSYDGNNSVYCINTETRQIERVVGSDIGVNYFNPLQNSDTAVYSVYTSTGYKPVVLSADSIKAAPIENIEQAGYLFSELLSIHENVNIQDSVIPQLNFNSKKYSKLKHIFNVHSWLVPFYANLESLPDESLQLYPGVTLLSQNSLSSITSSISYYFHNGYHYIRPSVSIRMFYPILTIDYNAGGPSSLIANRADPGSTELNFPISQEVNSSISIPLNYSTSRYTLQTTPEIRNKYKNLYVADSTNHGNASFESNQVYYYKGYSTLDYRINFYLATKMAYKSLRPKWGISLFSSYLAPLVNKQFWDENTVGIASFYLPGILRHQSTRLLFGFEEGLGKRLSVPRGMSASNFIQYGSAQKFSVDYAAPLLYPNLSLGPVVYIKRIQANFFYDYFQYHKNYTLSQNSYTYSSHKSSAGVELGFETNLLRFFWTFVPTIRYSYLIESNGYNIGFFFTTKYGFSLGRAVYPSNIHK